MLVLLLQLGGVPATDTYIGAFMWFLWMLCVLSQLAFTLLAEVALMMAYFNLENQYRHCMVEFDHGHALFNVIIPCMLIHPEFVVRHVALFTYYLALIWGGLSAGILPEGSHNNPVAIAGLVLFLPGTLIVGAYFIFTLSFLYGLVFFVPMVLALLLFAFLLLEFLYVLKYCVGGADVYLEDDDRRKSLEGTIQGAIAGSASTLNIAKQLRSMLWWTWPAHDPSELFNLGANWTKDIVVATIFGLALSPVVIFGTWMAFYSYLGHSTDEVMQIPTDAYNHVFKVFTLKYTFAWPILNFDLSLLEDIIPALEAFVNSATIPPYKLIEATFVCSALSFCMGLIKPVVSGMAAVVAAYDESAKNTPIGKVNRNTFTQSRTFIDLYHLAFQIYRPHIYLAFAPRLLPSTVS
uniref:Uncharacterized protein n=2 Tax=Florenciella parvula TaxID=236787 RepID=A0A7S2BJX3_9STRA|mmetsp:Transcript_17393/g.36368  ORF Transcript_17393/g.36368 Transcript_17393/m.36368 type:complete len:407 (+) Transcript_17393:821-2041(+)